VAGQAPDRSHPAVPAPGIDPSHTTQAMISERQRERGFEAFLAESVESYIRPILRDIASRGEAARARAPRELAAAIGERYTIDSIIGVGGMATVYLAHDDSLGRAVAIKVFHSTLADSVGAERFKQEIELTARLEHSRIVPVHDRGDASGLLYFVMRYFEGGSLRQYLEHRGQLPIPEAVALARDVANALDHAHAHGVVHRDIKPANILLEGSNAFVADFGIAQLIDIAGHDRLTRTGVVIGTPEYMSPEQGEPGGRADARGDVYALGCVLYEMLGGEPPFTAPSRRDVLAKHASAAIPDIGVLRATVTPAMRRVVEKALQKSPADRYQTCGEFVDAFETAVLEAPPRPSSARWLRMGAAAAILFAAGLLVPGFILQPTALDTATWRQITFSGSGFRPAVSPDGQLLAYTIEHAADVYSVFIQDLISGKTDSIARARVFTMEWSPDGSRLLIGTQNGFLVFSRAGRQERKVFGKTICQVRAHWLPDSRRVSRHCAVVQRGIAIINLETEDSIVIPMAGLTNRSVNAGSWSPNGRLFAVANRSLDPVGWAIHVIGLDGHTQVAVEDTVRLASPRWTSDGSALYYNRDDADIWKVRVSSEDGSQRQAPSPVHRQLDIPPKLGGTFSRVDGEQFSLTRDETRMAYTKGIQFSNLWIIEATGDTSRPHTQQLTTGTALRWSPVVSPDGHWIAFVQQSGTTAEVFRMPATGGDPTPITLGARVWGKSRIAWSPDGSRIAFVSVRSGKANLWIATINGGRLQSFDRTRVHTSGQIAWAPGERIAYQPAPHFNIRLLDPADGSERTLVPRDSGFFYSPSFSPDGSQLAVNWTLSLQNHSPYVFDMRDGSYRKLAGYWLPGGWSPDSRYVYAFSDDKAFRSEVRGNVPQQLMFRAPFREIECTRMDPARPSAFICAGFESKSDIWMLENFRSRSR
jgi:eukaryotic-like serine/threonine-protein kinase